jgi:hypothetical protein
LALPSDNVEAVEFSRQNPKQFRVFVFVLAAAVVVPAGVQSRGSTKSNASTRRSTTVKPEE